MDIDGLFVEGELGLLRRCSALMAARCTACMLGRPRSSNFPMMSVGMRARMATLGCCSSAYARCAFWNAIAVLPVAIRRSTAGDVFCLTSPTNSQSPLATESPGLMTDLGANGVYALRDTKPPSLQG